MLREGQLDSSRRVLSQPRFLGLPLPQEDNSDPISRLIPENPTQKQLQGPLPLPPPVTKKSRLANTGRHRVQILSHVLAQMTQLIHIILFCFHFSWSGGEILPT